MNWQQFKDNGEPIYFMMRSGESYYVWRGRRVIHSVVFSKFSTTRCVRYQSRWHPLHEPDELKTRYRNEDGTYSRVFLGGKPLNNTDEKLPFVRIWDEPGSHYPVFGY